VRVAKDPADQGTGAVRGFALAPELDLLQNGSKSWAVMLAIGSWRAIDPTDWMWLAAVGVSGALGQLWLTEAFRRAPPSVVGPFEYTAILWAFGIDWIFWSAQPTRALLIGAGVVIASGIYVIVDERRMAQLAMNPGSPPP